MLPDDNTPAKAPIRKFLSNLLEAIDVTKPVPDQEGAFFTDDKRVKPPQEYDRPPSKLPDKAPKTDREIKAVVALGALSLIPLAVVTRIFNQNLSFWNNLEQIEATSPVDTNEDLAREELLQATQEVLADLKPLGARFNSEFYDFMTSEEAKDLGDSTENLLKVAKSYSESVYQDLKTLNPDEQQQVLNAINTIQKTIKNAPEETCELIEEKFTADSEMYKLFQDSCRQ